MTTAALYLRSSKDRSDVSIASQRRELQALASSRALQIVAEYSDVVESAKSEFRDGFQRLIRDIKRPDRGWTVLLLTDTSRLSRRRYVAQVFKHECRKHAVELVYSKVPEVDPISQVILDSVLEAMDEVHSLMSREKGLAGMAENVRSGFRAGGRAPFGYQLRHHDTGAIRDGAPVRKSTLALNHNAPAAARYLAERSGGVPRMRAAEAAGIRLAPTTLIGMEWNALTYAGHTVWNVHQERIPGGGYKGGRKRRPREEWVIQRGTHESLITDAQAELILAQIAGSNRSKVRRTPATYLLTGLLKTPSGEPWFGNGSGHYRLKPASGARGAYVSQSALEHAVVRQAIADLRAPAFARALATSARQYQEARAADPAVTERKQMKELQGRIQRLLDMVERAQDPAPLLRRLDELEASRKALLATINRLEVEYTKAATLAGITAEHVQRMLRARADGLLAHDRERTKDSLQAILERVELDPETLDCRMHYAIGIDRNRVASPRVDESIPALRTQSVVNLGNQ